MEEREVRSVVIILYIYILYLINKRQSKIVHIFFVQYAHRFFPFCGQCSNGGNQDVRVGGKHPYPLSHLTANVPAPLIFHLELLLCNFQSSIFIHICPFSQKLLKTQQHNLIHFILFNMKR